MKKTADLSSRIFVTDYIYSAQNYDFTDAKCEDRSLALHILPLKKSGMTVTTKEQRYSTKITIEYNARQYNKLFNWLAQHLGYSNDYRGLCLSDTDKIELKEIIDSGEYCIF